MLNLSTSPVQMRRVCLAVAAVTTTASVLVLTAWGLRLVPEEVTRPYLLMMVYQLLLLTGVVALGVAATITAQQQVGAAFGAGYRAALAHADEAPAPERRGRKLRVIR